MRTAAPEWLPWLRNGVDKDKKKVSLRVRGVGIVMRDVL
jgi:hypothetical protein